MLEPGAECPLTPCLRLLSGAWTPEVLFYLERGPLRFGELRRALGRVSSKVLTARLRGLEGKGVVSRTVLPTNPPSVEYALTPMGRELLPVLDSISAVSVRLRDVYGF